MNIKERVINTIESVIDHQNKKGINKYGITIDDVSADDYDWQAMINEELIDAIQYAVKENVRLAQGIKEASVKHNIPELMDLLKERS